MLASLRERANVKFERDGIFFRLQVAFFLQQVDAEELVVAPAGALFEVGREFAHDALVGTNAVQQLDAILVRRSFCSALHHLHRRLEFMHVRDQGLVHLHAQCRSNQWTKIVTNVQCAQHRYRFKAIDQLDDR